MGDTLALSSAKVRCEEDRKHNEPLAREAIQTSAVNAFNANDLYTRLTLSTCPRTIIQH